MTTVSIHQPNFLPYLGFFRKVALSDIFIIYDTALYSKSDDWQKRNRIKTPQGVRWLTVPVTAHTNYDFRAVKLSDGRFIQRHFNQLTNSYRAAPYFKTVFRGLKKAYEQPAMSLGTFNVNLLMFLFEILEIKTTVCFAHEIDLGGSKSTAANLKMCQALNADVYLSGVDGRNYLDFAQFDEAEIEVRINDFVARPYAQQWGGEFVPNLSVIDALFNIGPSETKKLLA